MSWIDTIYLAIAGAVVLLSLNNPRGVGWVAAFTAAFFLSGWYWRSPGLSPELVAGLCDAAIVALVVVMGRYVWEMWAGLIAMACMLVNIVYLVNNVSGAGVVPHDIYSVALELLNLTALLTIGGVSAFQQKGSTGGIAFHPWVSFLGVARPFGRQDR
jgi:hypothetical protein